MSSAAATGQRPVDVRCNEGLGGGSKCDLSLAATTSSAGRRAEFLTHQQATEPAADPAAEGAAQAVAAQPSDLGPPALGNAPSLRLVAGTRQAAAASYRDEPAPGATGGGKDTNARRPAGR